MKMRNFSYLILVAVLLSVACGRRNDDNMVLVDSDSMQNYVAEGDSTLYVIACDGCDETQLVVFSPKEGKDPDTLDITKAFKEMRIFGRPTVGDRLAVVLDPENRRQVLMVVNMETLTGTWTYKVMPEWRIKMEDDFLKTMNEEQRARFDSLRDSLMVPREYGFTLKPNYQAQSVGRVRGRSSLGEESPVVYPPVKRYVEWHIFNGKLILTERLGGLLAADSSEVKVVNDTADFVLLRNDTLALKFGEEVVGYQLRPDSLNTRH